MSAQSTARSIEVEPVREAFARRNDLLPVPSCQRAATWSPRVGVSHLVLFLFVLLRPVNIDAGGQHGGLRARPREPAGSTYWYDSWLDDVRYIMTDSEGAKFKSLTNDSQRRQFIERFWEIRNPEPGSARNAFREEYYRWLAFAREHFSSPPGTRDDRTQIYLQLGPPDARQRLAPGSDSGMIVERWTYRHVEQLGDNVTVEFEDPSRHGEYRVVIDPLRLIDHTPSAMSPR